MDLQTGETQIGRTGSSPRLETVRTQSHYQDAPAQDTVGFWIKTLVWISRIVPIGAALIFGLYLLFLFATPEIWKTNVDATDQEKQDREGSRGTFVSLLGSFIVNGVGVYMFHIKVKEALFITNFCFILCPVVGFILDQSIGTDEGLKIAFTAEGFRFAFGILISGDFMRFIITIFLDLFISNPMQDVIKYQAKQVGVISVLMDKKDKPALLGKYDQILAVNFPSLLQSIVAVITFQAYTNQTRFNWAYAAADIDRAIRISPGTIMLSTSLAAALYLNFYMIMDRFSEREYFNVNTKVLYVLFILVMLAGLNMTNNIEAPVEGEEFSSLAEGLADARWVLGLFLFTAVLLYGFVYPLYTRLGCCGRCKPTKEMLEDTDHFTDQPHKEIVPAEHLRTLSRQITAMQGQLHIMVSEPPSRS